MVEGPPWGAAGGAAPSHEETAWVSGASSKGGHLRRVLRKGAMPSTGTVQGRPPQNAARKVGEKKAAIPNSSGEEIRVFEREDGFYITEAPRPS